MLKALKQILEYQLNNKKVDIYNYHTYDLNQGYYKALSDILLIINKLENKEED